MRPSLRAHSPRGLSLIEIMIAMVILTVVLLGMGRYMVDFSRTVRKSESRTVAVNLAAQRLSEIRASPNYTNLETNFATTETSITGFPGYTRSTIITHTGGPRPTYTNDYKVATVTVTGPGLSVPIRKTIVVAVP